MKGYLVSSTPQGRFLPKRIERIELCPFKTLSFYLFHLSHLTHVLFKLFFQVLLSSPSKDAFAYLLRELQLVSQ